MIVDSVLNNAKAYIKGQIVDCSLAIEEGKIHKVGKETQMPHADAKLDLHNLLVLPGLIDEHVHLRDEKRSYKEDFTSGTAAAAAGGFTTVLDMPNNDPVTMSAQALNNRMVTAERKILVNVGFYSEFPRNLIEINDIIKAGALGFKLFMSNQVGGLDIDDDHALKEACEEISKFKVPFAVHAEDSALLATNKAKLKQARKVELDDFLRAHSETVELKAIQRILKASENTTVHLHFCHISTEQSLKIIKGEKKVGRVLTCEVTPNHLTLSVGNLLDYGQLVIMAPPLRDKHNVDALWRGIDDNSVDSMGSDHAPHSAKEKAGNDVWDVKVGIPGLETTLPLMLTYVRKNKLSLSQLVKLIAEKPAEIFRLNDRGYIEAGKAADLTIVDYNHQFKIQASEFKTKAKFSPYDGWEVWGKPAKTIVNGELVFDEGEIVNRSGIGKIIRGNLM